MPRPGVTILSRAEPVPRAAPTNTGVLFLVDRSTTGPAVPTQVRSLTEYATVFGARTAGQTLYDCVDTYFREGGSQLWVSAVIGASATTVQLLAALDKIDKSYGPGQVVTPGLTAPADQAAVLVHCAARNRVALLDPPASATTAAQIVTAAASMQSDANARYGSWFAPSAVVPGVAGGTSRTVPYSIVEAGLIARSDVTNNPNVAAAGVNGQCVFATDLAIRFTDTERDNLNDAGVNAARLLWGGVETYGYRTLVPAATADTWLSLGYARLNMAIVAQAEVIGERYVFSPLDGQGRTLARFGGDLRAMLVPYYEQGALYGNSAEDAFQVNVGSAVNTPTTIAAGELHAVLSVRMSPFSERVIIEIVKVATTQAIAA